MAKFRKLIALVLVIVMSFSLLGVTGAFADGEGEEYVNNEELGLYSKGDNQSAATSEQTVYVYVKNTEYVEGSTVNGHGYYTIGTITLNLPAAEEAYEGTEKSVYNTYKTAVTTALGDLIRFNSNNGIELGNVKWYTLHCSDGADDYVNSGNWAWHLDGEIAKVYDVTYKANSNSNTKDIVCGFMESASVAAAANEFTYADHTFAGWNTAADGTGTPYAVEAEITSSIKQNYVLYAQWTKNPTAVSGTMDFTFTKEWSDNYNAAGARPNSISVTLAGPVGTAIPNATKTVTAADGWTCTWKDLPVASYTVSEEPVPNYTAGAASYTTGSATSGIIYHSCNNKTYKNLSGNFIVAKLTGNKGFIIWTPTELTTDAEKAEYEAAAAKFFRDIEGKTVTYQSGTVTGDPAITTGTTGSTGVTLVFGKTSTWAQFAVGTTTKVNTAATITNTYAPPAPTYKYTVLANYYTVTDGVEAQDNTATVTLQSETTVNSNSEITYQVKDADKIYAGNAYDLADDQTLTVTPAENGATLTLKFTRSVTTPVYAYTVNYYKDGIDAANLLGSVSGEAVADAKIPYVTSVAAANALSDSWDVPAGYKDGTASNELAAPYTVTSTAANNVVNVVFTKNVGEDQLGSATLTVNKKDASGNLITTSAATFTLTDKSDATKVYSAKTVNGVATFTFSSENIPAGTYTLTETVAPAGYVKAEISQEIVVTSNYEVKLGNDNLFHKIWTWLVGGKTELTVDVTNTAKTYTVTYYIDGTVVNGTTGVAFGSAVPAYTYTAPEGITYDGKWYSDNGYTIEATIPAAMPAGNLVFYGHTTETEYTVSINLQAKELGGDSYSSVATATKTLKLSELDAFVTSKLNSYTFTGVSFFDRGSTRYQLNNPSYVGMYAGSKEYGMESKDSAVGLNAETLKAALLKDGTATLTYSFAQIVHYSVDNGYSTVADTADVNQIFTTNTAAGVTVNKLLADSQNLYNHTGWKLNGSAYTVTGEVSDTVLVKESATLYNTVKPVTKTVNGIDQVWYNFVSVWAENDQNSKTLGYTVEYYKDGVLDSTKTQSVTESVWAGSGKTEPTVNKSAINTTNAFGEGYSFVGSDPETIPETIADKGVIKINYTRDTGVLTVSKSFNGDVFTPAEVTVTVTGPDGYNETVILTRETDWTWEDRVPTGEYTVLETKNGATGYYTCVTSYLDGDMGENANTTDGKVTVSKTAAVVAMAVADVPGAWVTITNTYTYNPPYIPDPTPTPTPTPTPSEEPTPEPSEPPEEDLGDGDVPLGPGPEEDLGEDEVPMDAAPQTGDSSNAALMWLLLCASFSGLVVLAATSPKGKHSEDK